MTDSTAARINLNNMKCVYYGRGGAADVGHCVDGGTPHRVLWPGVSDRHRATRQRRCWGMDLPVGRLPHPNNQGASSASPSPPEGVTIKPPTGAYWQALQGR
jgi:hypothetical protein